jgi:hypothetical protein
MMVLKNYRWYTLVWIFPVRLFFEFITILYALVKLDFKRMAAVVLAMLDLIRKLPSLMSKRVTIRKMRVLSDGSILKKMYRGSIVIDYFVRGIQRAQDLKL